MTSLSKADYLKKYKSGGVDEKKKRRKKEKESIPKKQLSGMRIVEIDAFAPVAAANELDDDDESGDDGMEIRMLNEEIRNKAKSGGMKGAFKSTFTSIGTEIKTEPVDDDDQKIKEEIEVPTTESKFQMSLATISSSETTTQKRLRHDPQSSPKHERRTRHDSDSDQSPARGRHSSPVRRHKDYRSPPRRRRHDSDNSPPRKKRHDTPDRSPPRRKRHDSDDQSPPRRRQHHVSPPRRRRHDSDESPPRRRQRRNSDQSPPRARTRRDSDQSPARKVASPTVEGKQKTLDGKIAGLQSAKDLRDESDRLRAREAKMFEELDTSVSGRNAETRVREKQVKRGRKENPEDVEKKEREAKKQAELAEKYKDWNRGVKQLKDKQEQLDEMARVVAGPMTRTAEDVDMNLYLKERIHEADPMASLIKRKNREEAIDRGDLVYPTYDRPYPPNRYGIRPGYRWDGVDRSNGFENKLAISQNARKAVEKEMYSNSNVFD